MSNKKVVVVGAGCAGLSATYTLRKQGIDVITFEAQDVAGGRCRSVPEQGYNFFVGAGCTEPQWDTTFQYLDELGLANRVFPIKKQRFGIYRNGKIRTAFMGGNFWETIRTLPENIRFLFTGMPLKTYPQALKAFRAMRKHSKSIDTKTHNFDALADISNMSTEEFVLKHGGREAVDWVFHTFLATMVLARPKDISVAHPISLFALMKGMCSFEGGLGILTAALYEQVKDSVQFSTPVKKIVIENGKVRGVETNDGFVEADHVICAVDAVIARQIIPDLPDGMRKPLETCKYSSGYYYQFGLAEHIVPGDTEMFVVVIPPNVESPLSWIARGGKIGEKPLMICTTRGWEDEKLIHLSPEERRRVIIKETQRFLPAFPDEPVITKPFRWDRAVNLESHMDDVEGLHLSGEYLFLIACTEGAYRTGKQAAERVIESLREDQRGPCTR